MGLGKGIERSLQGGTLRVGSLVGIDAFSNLASRGKRMFAVLDDALVNVLSKLKEFVWL